MASYSLYNIWRRNKGSKIIVSNDGTKSVINNISIPIMDDKGKIIMGMYIFSDISESKVELIKIK